VTLLGIGALGLLGYTETRRRWFTLVVLASVLTVVGARGARAGTINVPGNSNIYGAGHTTAPGPAGDGGGSLPPLIGLAGGGFLTFQVSGQVSYNGGGNFYGGDGG